MAETFLVYLRRELDRVVDALGQARTQRDGEAIASLEQQRRIVEDQLARWEYDLTEKRAA